MRVACLAHAFRYRFKSRRDGSFDAHAALMRSLEPPDGNLSMRSSQDFRGAL
jgi:hypothetical protein